MKRIERYGCFTTSTPFMTSLSLSRSRSAKADEEVRGKTWCEGQRQTIRETKDKILFYFTSWEHFVSLPSLSISRLFSLSLDALEARKSGCGSGRSGDEEEEWRRPIGEARFPGMEPIRMVDFGENIKSRQIARIFVLSKFGSSGNGKKCGRYFCSHFSHNKSKAKIKLSNAKPTTYVKGQYNYPTLYLLPR